ncbi:MAG: hypothetical protein ACFBRM_10330 [Pikeienuella sp.]
MKSANNIQFNKAWWNKEKPDGIKKSDGDFIKAIEAYAAANAALRNPDQKAIDAFEQACDALEKAGKKVAAEAKDLEKAAKKAKDKAAQTDLANTITVMERVLPGEIRSALSNLPDLEDDDDEAAGDSLTDPTEHSAYLKKIAGKLKKRTFSFGLGLPSNDPADMRFLFHPKKAGRGLAGKLKKAVGAKKMTWGLAGTTALTSEMGVEDEGARTLVLNIEGRMIPGLAKRVKVMLKRMKVASFGRVKILKDGAEVDNADDETDDQIEEMDLDTVDPEDAAVSEELEDTGAPPPPTDEPPEPGPEPDRAQIMAQIKQRLTKLVPQIAGLEGQDKAHLAKMAQDVGVILKSDGNPDAARELLDRMEEALAKPQEETPPDPAAEAKRLEGILLRVGKRLQTLAKDAPDVAQPLIGKIREIQSLLREGQLTDAQRGITDLVGAVEEAEARFGQNVAPEDSADPMEVWRAGKEAADRGVNALVAALQRETHPDFKEVAAALRKNLDSGLIDARDGNQAKLTAALFDYKMASGDAKEKAAAKLKAEVKAYTAFINSNELVGLCEGNPFGVGVSIREPIAKALTRIEAIIG